MITGIFGCINQKSFSAKSMKSEFRRKACNDSTNTRLFFVSLKNGKHEKKHDRKINRK